MKNHALTLAALVAGATLSTGCTSAVDAYLKDASTDLSVAEQTMPPTCTEGDKGFAAMEKEFEAIEPGTEAGPIRVAAFYTSACLRAEEVKATGADSDINGMYLASVPVNEDLLDIMIRAYDEEPNDEYRARMNSAFYGTFDHTFVFALYSGILENGEVYPAPDAPQGTMGGVEGASPEQLATIQKAWCEYAGDSEYKRYVSGKAPQEGMVTLERGEAISGLLAHGCTKHVDAIMKSWLGDFDAAPGAAEAKKREGGAEVEEWKGAGESKFIDVQLAKKGYPSAADIGQFINITAKHNPTAAKAQVSMLSEKVTSCAVGKAFLGSLQRDTEAAIADEVALFVKRHKGMCGD